MWLWYAYMLEVAAISDAIERGITPPPRTIATSCTGNTFETSCNFKQFLSALHGRVQEPMPPDYELLFDPEDRTPDVDVTAKHLFDEGFTDGEYKFIRPWRIIPGLQSFPEAIEDVSQRVLMLKFGLSPEWHEKMAVYANNADLSLQKSIALRDQDQSKFLADAIRNVYGDLTLKFENTELGPIFSLQQTIEAPENAGRYDNEPGGLEGELTRFIDDGDFYAISEGAEGHQAVLDAERKAYEIQAWTRCE